MHTHVFVKLMIVMNVKVMDFRCLTSNGSVVGNGVPIDPLHQPQYHTKETDEN